MLCLKTEEGENEVLLAFGNSQSKYLPRAVGAVC